MSGSCSFTRRTLKPSVTVLADEPGAPWVKYIHGERGQGTWTFFGGHDPEDPQHQFGDAPTPKLLQVNEADKDAFIKASKPIYEEFAKDVPGGQELIDKSLALGK